MDFVFFWFCEASQNQKKEGKEAYIVHGEQIWVHQRLFEQRRGGNDFQLSFKFFATALRTCLKQKMEEEEKGGGRREKGGEIREEGGEIREEGGERMDKGGGRREKGGGRKEESGGRREEG